MRSGTRHFAIGAAALTVAIALAVSLGGDALGCPRIWDPYTPIDVDFIQPNDDIAVCFDASVPCSVTASDQDRWIEDPHQGFAWETDFTYDWSCTAGTITGSGTSVTWHAPASGGGRVRITCTVNDVHTQPTPPDIGTRDDPAQPGTVRVRLPFHDISILEPTGTVGGVVPVRIRVRTCAVTLDRLVVKEHEDTALHPWEWHTLWDDEPPQAESMQTDDETGITTAVYRVDWSTPSGHNGPHVLRAEATCTIECSQQQVEDTTQRTPTLLNLAITSCDPEGVVLWDGAEGTTVPVTVNLEDNDLSDPMDIAVSLYATDVDNRESWDPVRTLTLTDVTGANHVLYWDGKDDGQSYLDPGMYTFDVDVTQTDINTDESPPLQVADSAQYRSDYLSIIRAADGSGNPIYDAEYAGLDDGGTPEDPADDNYKYFVRSYVLKDTEGANASEGEIWLYDPDLLHVGTWDISTLPCRNHNDEMDGLTASQAGLQHDLLVRVPVGAMSKGGTYRFVVHLKDGHPYDYRDHRERWALDLNTKYTIRKIEYMVFSFRGRTWYVTWCRHEFMNEINKRTIDLYNGLTHAPRMWVFYDPPVDPNPRPNPRTSPAVPSELFGTQPGEIRSAINGGFLATENYWGWGTGPIVIEGDLGCGTAGHWLKARNAGKWRHCFGMNATGASFGYDRTIKIKTTTIRPKGPPIIAYYHEVPPAFEMNWPYGLSNVGHLVDAGARQNHKDSGCVFHPDDDARRRTTVAWSGKGDFFLAATDEASWNDLTAFFANPDDSNQFDPNDPTGANCGGLTKHLRGSPYLYDLGQIQHALFLDGGASTEIAYRWCRWPTLPPRPPIDSGPSAPQAWDCRAIPNIIGVKVYQND